eukprot:1613244-Alexandrium_andersonii.AAC.1
MADYEAQADALGGPAPVDLSWPRLPNGRGNDWAREGDWWRRVAAAVQPGTQAAADRGAQR